MKIKLGSRSKSRLHSNRKGMLTILLGIIQDFITFTSLHGFKNIAEDLNYLNRPSTRRKLSKRYILLAKCCSITMWGGAITIGILLAAKMIYLVWLRSQITPTLTTVDTYYHPIWDVPFPAITICNSNIVYRPAMERILKQFSEAGFNETAIRSSFSLLNVMVRPRNVIVPSEFNELRRAEQHFNISVEKMMMDVMQPCENMLKQCFWLNQKTPCNELFHVSKSSLGFCCSFNYEGTPRYPGDDNYYVSGAGENVGLDLLITPEPQEYVSNIQSFYGVQVAIHSQDDFPDINNPILVQPGYDARIFITPSVLVSDSSVRNLPLAQRKCLFQDERTTQMRKQYTHTSCMIDCRVEHFVKLCNCIPFFYPYSRLPQYKNVTYCRLGDMPCFQAIRARVASIVPPDDAVGFDNIKNKSNIGLDCDCMPGCQELRYSFQTLSTDRRQSSSETNSKLNFSNIFTDVDSVDWQNTTTMFIGFKDVTCIRYRRTIYMTWDNLLASVGGIFGLCMGASTISLIEVIYFFLTRIFGKLLFHALPQRSLNAANPIRMKKIEKNNDFHSKKRKQRIFVSHYIE